MHIGIVGSKTYVYQNKVYTFMKRIKDTFGKYVTVYSGGNTEGAEKFVKDTALEFEFRYIEYNPSFTGANLYSAMPDNYFGKPYHFQHYLDRYLKLISVVEKLVIFIDNTGPIDEDLKFLIKQAKKRKIPFVIIT